MTDKKGEVTNDIFRQWLIGFYAEKIGIIDSFSIEKARKADAFANEVMRFLNEHKLLK